MKPSTKTLFIVMLIFHLSFYLSGLLMGKTVFNFAGDANTDGIIYYLIARAPFAEPPIDNGFRYATFLYPLLTSLIARGDAFLTAVVMELINIVAFSLSIAIFYRLSKDDGFPLATVFYAFNPILLISTHGGMNEPLYFALVFGALLAFRLDRFIPSTILLSLAVLSRPDFVIFILPFFAIAKRRRFLPYLTVVFLTIAGFGYYLMSRFGLQHFTSFARGVDSGLPPMLGIPFYTFFQNRFFGATGTPQILGSNLLLNEFITWTIFIGLILSVLIMIRKREFDGLSLSLIVLGSIIQPAYSYFSGYFRFISMTPYLYRLPPLLLKGRILLIVAILYMIGGISLLVAWFY